MNAVLSVLLNKLAIMHFARLVDMQSVNRSQGFHQSSLWEYCLPIRTDLNCDCRAFEHEHFPKTTFCPLHM